MRPQNLPKASTLKPVLQRVSNPPIIPIPQRRAGNSIPHSHTKTRRSWAANKGRYDLPVNVIGGAAFLPAPEVKPGDKRRPHGFKLKGVKMTVRDLRSVDKAGGIEGLLVC
jgi:ribosomal protein L28